MKILKFLLLIVVIFPGTRGCVHKPQNVIQFDCTKRGGYVIPGTPNIRVSASRCNEYIYKKQAMSNVINLFVERYSAEFDLSKKRVWQLLENLSIEVSSIPKTVKNVYDVNGNFLSEDTPIVGLAINKNNIWVEIKTSRIWTSALAHELVHIIIWRVNLVHGDPDHEGNMYTGWTKKHTKFIKRFNNELFELEL